MSIAITKSIPMPIHKLAMAVACLLLCAAPLHAEETTPSPSDVVVGLHDTLTEAMKQANDLGYEGRFKLIEPAVATAIDRAFMAEKSIGRHWRKLSEADQARWLETFGALTVANYAGRFKGYSGEHFTLDGEEDAPHDTRLVKTTLVLPEDEDVVLNYRLHRTQDGWRIIDIYMNGTVSELSLRRSEYSSKVKRDGIDELIAAVESMLADFAAGNVEDDDAAIASRAAKAQ